MEHKIIAQADFQTKI